MCRLSVCVCGYVCVGLKSGVPSLLVTSQSRNEDDFSVHSRLFGGRFRWRITDEKSCTPCVGGF